jgi:HK97 family phage prohead protease
MSATLAPSRPSDLTYKAVAAEPAVLVETRGNPAARVARFVLTSDKLDLDGDVVLARGMDVSQYLRNPVVLWAHRFDMPPVGKCVKLSLADAGTKLVADVEFASTKFASELFELVKGGFLRAVSVGFKSLVAGLADHTLLMARPELRSCKRVVSAATLYEVSLVPIPSNPDALLVAKGRGQRAVAGGFGGEVARLARALGISEEAACALPCKKALSVLEHLDSRPALTAPPARPCAEAKAVQVRLRTMQDVADDIVVQLKATGFEKKLVSVVQARIDRLTAKV